jgi:hypothetical protein
MPPELPCQFQSYPFQTLDAIFGMSDIRDAEFFQQFDGDFRIEQLVISSKVGHAKRYLYYQ